MKRNFKVFLISGKARHGKTSLAKMMTEHYKNRGIKAIVTSYAKYIKMYATELTDWDGTAETKPREFLQNMGTDIREKLGKKNFFIERLREDLEIYENYCDVVFIDDVRMPIEIDYFKEKYKENAISIKVERPNFKSDLNEEERLHETEVGLDNYDSYDYTIVNDKSLEELDILALDLVGRIEK